MDFPESNFFDFPDPIVHMETYLVYLCKLILLMKHIDYQNFLNSN